MAARAFRLSLKLLFTLNSGLIVAAAPAAAAASRVLQWHAL
jgi:hypothetical protein